MNEDQNQNHEQPTKQEELRRQLQLMKDHLYTSAVGSALNELADKTDLCLFAVLGSREHLQLTLTFPEWSTVEVCDLEQKAQTRYASGTGRTGISDTTPDNVEYRLKFDTHRRHDVIDTLAFLYELRKLLGHHALLIDDVLQQAEKDHGVRIKEEESPSSEGVESESESETNQKSKQPPTGSRRLCG